MISTTSQQAPSLVCGRPGMKGSPKVVSPPCSKRLRSDLLNKLGIVDDRLQKLPPLPTMSAAAENGKTTQKSILGPVKVMKAPLKKDEGPDLKVRTSPSFLVSLGAFFNVGSPSSVASAAPSVMESDDSSSISSASTGTSGRRRGLTFDEEVSVVHIPRREQYSSRIKQHLWHSSESLQANIMRNTIEYAADGWKWQNVREESQHILCRESGELIHPVHQEIARLIRHEQGLPADTPVWTPFLKQAPIGSCSSRPEPSSQQRHVLE